MEEEDDSGTTKNPARCGARRRAVGPQRGTRTSLGQFANPDIEYIIVLYGREIHVGPRKAKRNLRVQGVSFETAKEVFDDPHHVAGDNYFIESGGQQRYQIIGMTGNLVLLLVVFVDRSQPNTEVTHLISARKAVDYEESIYKDQFR
jgi:uncharacterized DUF497 family protein